MIDLFVSLHFFYWTWMSPMLRHWDDMGLWWLLFPLQIPCESFNSQGSRWSPKHPRPVKKEKRRPAPLALTERAASRGGIPNRRCSDGWQIRAAGILTRVPCKYANTCANGGVFPKETRKGILKSRASGPNKISLALNWGLNSLWLFFFK